MLIYDDSAYLRSRNILKASKKGIELQRKSLAREGLTKEEIDRVLDPSLAFLHDMAHDVEWYERAKRGEIPKGESLSQIGRMLVALRLGKGISQKVLADKLGVSEIAIAQYEHNEYCGISVDRIIEISEALGFEGKISFASAQVERAA